MVACLVLRRGPATISYDDYRNARVEPAAAKDVVNTVIVTYIWKRAARATGSGLFGYNGDRDRGGGRAGNTRSSRMNARRACNARSNGGKLSK